MGTSTGAGDGLSLVQGWLPVTVELAAALVLLVVLARAGRRWWTVWVPAAAVLGVLAAFLVRWRAAADGAATDPPPAALWVWLGLTVAAVVVLAAGWRDAPWWRRAISVAAVPLALSSAGVVLNQWVGYLPTVGSAWAQATAAPLPDQVSENTLGAITARRSGAVVPVTIPATASGFVHRQEFVYLPPVWFTGRDRATLAVVLMIGGEFGAATDWIRAGNAVAAADRYASAHAGRAPVLVFADAGGSFDNDTECVDGPRGRSADHLTGDVRPYVVSRFGVSRSPARWGVAGFSTGGTCAIDLAVMHPELFGAFDDIAGDLAPNTGTRAQTVARLFGGDASAYGRFDPMAVIARHGRYTATAGRFDNSTGRSANGSPVPGGQRLAAERLCAAASARGISCRQVLRPGGHNWQFATTAFADSLSWLAERLGGPTVDHGATS